MIDRPCRDPEGGQCTWPNCPCYSTDLLMEMEEDMNDELEKDDEIVDMGDETEGDESDIEEAPDQDEDYSDADSRLENQTFSRFYYLDLI